MRLVFPLGSSLIILIISVGPRPHANNKQYRLSNTLPQDQLAEYLSIERHPDFVESYMKSTLAMRQEYHSQPYVHSRLLYFPTKRQKRRSQSAFANRAHRVYSNFWVAKKDRKIVSVAAFYSPEPQNFLSSIWVAALIKSQGKGKHVIIWDCSPRADSKSKNKLPHPDQRQFWKQAQRNGASTLWYGAAQDDLDPLDELVGQIVRLVKYGDKPMAVNDLRLAGCTQI